MYSTPQKHPPAKIAVSFTFLPLFFRACRPGRQLHAASRGTGSGWNCSRTADRNDLRNQCDRLFRRSKVERNGIHAMARILRCEPFALEHMAQMTATTGTDDLGPPAVGIGHPFNSAGNLIVETGPATTGIELVRRTVQRRTAPAAMIRPRFMVVFVFTGKRALRPLVQDYPLLFRGQWFHNLRIYGTQRSQNE